MTTRDRLAAIVDLRDSGPGRPAQAVEIDDHECGPAFIILDGTMPAVQ